MTGAPGTPGHRCGAGWRSEGAAPGERHREHDAGAKDPGSGQGESGGPQSTGGRAEELQQQKQSLDGACLQVPAVSAV